MNNNSNKNKILDKKIIKKLCPLCKGTGVLKIRDKEGNVIKEIECRLCNGKGVLIKEVILSDVKVISKEKPLTSHTPIKNQNTTINNNINKEDTNTTVPKISEVYIVSNYHTFKDIEKNKAYKGVVTRIEKYGVFVNLNEFTRGLLRVKDMQGKSIKDFKEGDEIIVYTLDVRPEKREIDFLLIPEGQYKEIKLTKEVPVYNLKTLHEKLLELKDDIVKVYGEVIQITQTPGPTIFVITDGTATLWIAALETPGLRAHPEIKIGDIIEVIGRVIIREGKPQIERIELKKLEGEEEQKIRQKIEEEIDKRSEPANIDFLVKDPILEKLRSRIRIVAKRIRRAVLDGRPIIIRHHADTDGYCGAVALERAILPLIKEYAIDEEAVWHLFKRRPSRAPFYELEDITKDLVFAMEDHLRFGQKLPLIILLDNGSTDEDIPAIAKAKVYDIEVIVIDHHYPGEIQDGKVEVDNFVDYHINPYLVGGDNNLTAGILATEVARLVNPSVEEEIKHLAGIAAVGDRAKGESSEKYIKLATEHLTNLSKKYGSGKVYTEEDLKKISLCVDFEAFYLRFMDGKGIIDDVLGCSLETFKRHEKIIEILYEQANKFIERQMKAVIPALKTEILENGIILNLLDVEKYAHKFTFPAPGKTTGLAHDYIVEKYGEDKPIITLSYGPDFLIIRATDPIHEKYNFNLNKIVEDLDKEIPEASVDGGGHECAGSIKFVEGLRDKVIEKMITYIKSLKIKNE